MYPWVTHLIPSGKFCPANLRSASRTHDLAELQMFAIIKFWFLFVLTASSSVYLFLNSTVGSEEKPGHTFYLCLEVSSAKHPGWTLINFGFHSTAKHNLAMFLLLLDRDCLSSSFQSYAHHFFLTKTYFQVRSHSQISGVRISTFQGMGGWQGHNSTPDRLTQKTKWE